MTKPLAIVAGVGPGMGLALAHAFAQEGYAVAMLARRQSMLDDYARQMAAAGLEAKGYSTDLLDEASIASTFAQIAVDFGHPDVLIYNAALWQEKPAMELSAREFADDLALCATGAFVCAQAVYPSMKAAGKGALLFTGGGLALHPEYGANVAGLTAGKSALRGFVYALGKELLPDSIHVATVTIAGVIQDGTAFDPAAIAREYVILHQQPKAEWEIERVYVGKPVEKGVKL